MNIQLLNIIIQPILGAAAGYITNEYAINMLFKTYTPLKLGGVIPKTRELFIENLSQLVVEDIINKEKVEFILNDKSFIKNFESLVEDFFTKSIYEVTDNIAINNVPCISKSLSDIETFVSKQVEIELPKIIGLIADEIKLNDIIDENQINELSKELYSYVVNLARDTKLIDKFTQNVIYKNENISFMDLVGYDVSSAIAQNISDAILNTNNLRINSSDNINLLINKVLHIVNKNNSFTKFIEKIIIDNNDKLQDIIANTLIGFSKSSAFKEALIEFSKNVISYGKSLDINFISLLNPTFIENIEKIIVSQAPEMLEIIISFVNDNKNQLQQIIEESLNETINEQDSTKKALLGMAKGSIFNSIAKSDISSTVSDYLRDKNNVENICLFIGAKIKRYFETTTISQAINLLEKKEALSDISLCNFLTDYYSNNIHSIADKIIKHVISLLENEAFKLSLNTKIVDIIKDKIIFSSKTIDYINSSLSIYITRILDKNISEALGELITTNSQDLNSSLYDFLENNQANIVDRLSLGIKKFIENTKLKEILSNNSLDKISKLSCELADKKIHEVKTRVSEKSFYDIYNKINTTDDIYKKSSKMLKDEVVNNLNPLLHKFVKGLSVSNLNKLDDANLVKMAKGFMGNNLRPIMLFGGMLGLIAGILLAVLQPNYNVFSLVSITGAITYSLVGFMTNAIAINMLFKPYKEIKLIKNIPFLKHFSLGYIVKNKENLANNMSSAINEYLLTRDSMNELIDSYKYDIKASIHHNISNNNYEVIKTICNDNEDKIINSIYNYFIKAVNSNIGKVSNLCVDQIEHIKINDYVYDYKDKISEYFISSNKKYNKLILSGLIKIANSNASISCVLPKSIRNNINKSINKSLNDGFDVITNSINYENTKNLFISYHKDYEKLINNNISGLFSLENLIKADNIIPSINKYLNSSIKIGDVLNKRISTVSNKALYDFFDDINTNSIKVLKYIKPTISKAVQDKVTSSLNFLVRGAYNMIDGNKIIDTVVEKALLQKLPILIESKKDSIYENTSNYLNNRLLNMELKDIGMSVNTNIMNSISVDTLKQILDPLSTCVKKKSSSITIKSLISPLSLDNMQIIFSTYEKELSSLVDEVKSLIASNKTDIMGSINNLVDISFDDFINKTSINKLFKNIKSDDLQYISDNITNILFEDSMVNINVNDILASIKGYEKPLYAFELIDKYSFSATFEGAINNLLNSSDKKYILLETIDRVVKRATQKNFKLIDNDAKEYITNVIADAAILSLRNNLSTILSDIEFDKIAKEQIIEMKPKKIHKMFNSFAGKYFRALMFYGLFGAVFGINTIVGLVLSGVYGIKNIISKNK